MGAWKAIRIGDKPWELYDLANDPGEMNNLAYDAPVSPRWRALHKELSALMEKMHASNVADVVRMAVEADYLTIDRSKVPAVTGGTETRV